MAANVVSAAQPWEQSRRTAAPSRRARSTRPRRLWSGRATSTTHPPIHSDIHALRNDGIADRFMLHGRQGREKLAAMAPHRTLHPRRLEGGRPSPPRRRGRGPRPAPRRVPLHGGRRGAASVRRTLVAAPSTISSSPTAPLLRRFAAGRHQHIDEKEKPQHHLRGGRVACLGI